MSTDEEMKDERATERHPFDVMVEVGGALGPSFEARAVDLSRDGMHLRTTYLPELGQPVACRFDAGTCGNVLAHGEVVWKQEADSVSGSSGGEFGIRFTELDKPSTEALEKIITLGGKVPMAQDAGARVRLHIDGLGSPMRARIRDASKREVTVGSELGFLQVGKNLDLEDADTGDRRPAHIDRVEVEVDPESRIPRLVVALRYDDVEESVQVVMDKEDISVPEPEPMEMENEAAQDEGPPPEKSVAAKAQPVEETKTPAGAKLPEVFAAKIAPVFGDMAKRARTALAMLAAKRFAKKDEAPRRTTAPPPGGALHASGRKVVRAQDVLDGPQAPKKNGIDKKRVVIGAAVGVAAIAAYMVLHKPSSPPPTTAADTQSSSPIEQASSAAALSNLPPLLPANTTTSPIMADNNARPAPHGPIKVVPFGNPAVNHGTVLRLKMDGAIERINGASQATGFLVTVPGRRSVEPAGPLAARDARIGSIKVSNDNGGAELNVTFKDGVPAYQVRAKGDELEIVLAPAGKVEDPKKNTAKKSDPAAHPKKTHKK